MKTITDLNWRAIITEIVWPNLGTLIVYLVLFCILGLILGIIYVVLLWKKNIFIRKNKHYNWIVKLYVPAIIFVFLYFSIDFAFIYGAKNIIKKEESRVVNEVYESSVNQFFKNPKERVSFIQKLQSSNADFQKTGQNLSNKFINTIENNNIGNNFIDDKKNKLTHFIISKYQMNLYTATLYGLNIAAGTQIKSSKMSYQEINNLVRVLNVIEPAKIEIAIKSKLTEFVDRIVSSQINGLVNTTFLFFLLLIFIPIVEYKIYNWYINRSAKI